MLIKFEVKSTFDFIFNPVSMKISQVPTGLAKKIFFLFLIHFEINKINKYLFYTF